IAWRVRDEVAALSPERASDFAYDFQVIGDSIAGDYIEVLVGGARRDVLNSYVQTMREARAPLAIVDLDYFAIQNVAECYPDPPTRGVTLLVHGGRRYAALNVVAGARSAFTAGIELGVHSPGLDETLEDPASPFIQNFCDEVHHTLNFY